MPNRQNLARQHRAEKQTATAVRKQVRRSRKPASTRRRDWLQSGLTDRERADDFDLPTVERVLPRGERERRRTNEAAALAATRQAEPAASSPQGDAPGLRGTVIEVSSGRCRVEAEGKVRLCTLRGSLSARETGYTNLVAVGDQVIVSAQGASAGPGIVEAVLPRRSVLARPDVSHPHLQQVVVANADQLLVVASWREPALWLELLDRYLIAARRQNLAALICLNKVDLAADPATPRAALGPYRELGWPVLFTSTVTGEGITELRDLLRGRTTVLAGLSGVGKSSLLARVQPGLQVRIGAVSSRHHEGRHTTTQTKLFHLQIGGLVIDTPGIREWGLAGLHKSELVLFYPEIAALAPACAQGDCLHVNEAGCAVRATAEAGRPAARYETYRRILATLPA